MVQQVLTGFTHFFVQNETSKNLLIQHHFTNVTLSGDTRFDRVFENTQHPKKLALIEQFKGNDILLVGGSTWQPEEQILTNYSKLNRSCKMIIAPHDISENHVLTIEKLFNQNCIRYSQANETNVNSQPVLIIDNIGLLANIYQYADIAFVGGGFTGALHNILEPASFGNVVLFGSKHQKFHEARELITAKGAFEINNENDFGIKMNMVLANLDFYKNNSKKFVVDNVGATDFILQFIIRNSNV
jgi:3-deoxy-D-manno-octulosonic-acid transferase